MPKIDVGFWQRIFHVVQGEQGMNLAITIGRVQIFASGKTRNESEAQEYPQLSNALEVPHA